jgi:OFA family oxalate/formate antiporter-like MFS transporter
MGGRNNMTKKYNRVITVIATIAIQLCLGTAYVWSIFQNGIAETLFKGDNAAASLAYSFMLGTLTVGSTLGGKLQQKIETKYVVMIGGLILASGFFLASFVTAAAPWLLWITYGIMGGVGMGFSYSTTIACAQKWYPDKKGLISGVIVSSLGFSGVVFTPIIEALMKAFGGPGVGEFQTFRVLSLIFLVICTFGGLCIKTPPKDFLPEGYTPPAPGATNANVDFSPGKMLKTPQFYMLTITFMVASMGGLMMIGFAKPIAVAKGLAATASIGVTVVSVFNAAGRLFWGWASDRLGRKKTLIIILSGTAVFSLLVNLATGYLIYGLIAFIGFFYGGVLGTFPSMTSDMFGSKYAGTNYGLMMVGFGVGAVVSSYVAGYFKNLAANDINLMFPAFVIASVAAAIGIVLLTLVKKPKAAN